MAEWQPDDHDVQDTDEAGDDQFGKVYSIRYRRPQNPDGTYSLITVGFYNQDRWQVNGEELTYDEVAVASAPLPEERYGIGQQVELMICRDADDPGGTEEWCDYLYRSSWFAQAAPFTDEQIKSVMEHFDPSLIYWSGKRLDSDKINYTVEPVDPEDWDDSTILPPDLYELVTKILGEIDQRSFTDYLAQQKEEK